MIAYPLKFILQIHLSFSFYAEKLNQSLKEFYYLVNFPLVQFDITWIHPKEFIGFLIENIFQGQPVSTYVSLLLISH